MCFDFCTNLSEIFLILRRIERDIINVRRSSCNLSFILVGFLSILKFLEVFSEKYLRIKFDGNRSSGSRVVSCGRKDTQTVGRSFGRTDGQTERRDEANGRFLQFYERP
jgi:hypothetical protein